MVYLLLAAGLFAEAGYRQVWARLVAGLDGLPVAMPTSSAPAQARRRIGAAPLRASFALLAGPAAGAARWCGLLVCAIDGTTMSVPDTSANLAAYGRQTGSHGGSGYPLLRLVAVVACGTRTVIGAVFGPIGVGETTQAPHLLKCLRPGMLLPADRNFAVADLLTAIATTGAQALIRCKDGRPLPDLGTLSDGSRLSTMGAVAVRVVDAEITAVLSGGKRHTGPGRVHRRPAHRPRPGRPRRRRHHRHHGPPGRTRRPRRARPPTAGAPQPDLPPRGQTRDLQTPRQRQPRPHQPPHDHPHHDRVDDQPTALTTRHCD
ncbi:hypothetical protein F4560_001748 [Saccharothrix ecbatanensis]|uniref:DDE family transposase n=1 Tax=Saccharothrix ecbatanensis TaxID=1105145 RepID=A0A7W9HGV4_9PSEU|nr:hypothetical protein [Saccharothrix ecbatanensis]